MHASIAIPEQVREQLRLAPDAPGCYVMRDRSGRIIYVGKAVSVRKRVQSYFRAATLRRASPKLRGLVRSVASLEFVPARSEADALLIEGQLIKDYKPRYNVSFRDDKRFLMLRVDTRQAWPRFDTCRFSREDGATYFGPYVSSAAGRATLDYVERKFGLRKCAPVVPGESDYRHCHDDVIRHCSAPCVGRISAADYGERVRQACAFLRGETPALLEEIRESIRQAAGRLDFEKAAGLRDTLVSLELAVRKRRSLTGLPELRAGDAAEGVRQLRAHLALERPPRTIEAVDISTISGTHSVASLVCAVDGLPQRNRYRRFRIRTVEGVDDPAMMAEVVRRRFSRLRAEGKTMPDLLLLDGGPTQFAAARRELDALGLEGVAIAALAKRFEELYIRAGAPALRLPRDSAALKVLQALRDEAHRFALAYHRRLRAWRIRESALDEVPGIGEVRKQKLLRHFGSVRRIMRAAEAEIAAVPGIGPETARLIRACLLGEAPAEPGPDDEG